jgi:nucleotide-binding universal stress UspA family protein
MKTILVLTDLSKNAAHAAESAAWFAEQLHTGLVLWHCHPKIPVMPGYAGGAAIAGAIAGPVEGKEALQQALVELEDYMIGTDGKYKPQLSANYCEGSLQEELRSEISEQTFELIAIGASTDCAADHIFFGSDTWKVIETANCPVLIVPLNTRLDQLNKVVFATDFEPGDLKAIMYLEALSNALDFRIEIVHVAVNGNMDEAMAKKATAFNGKLANLKRPVTYKEIRGKEVVGRLNRISKQTGADMLAMTHHQYSFFKRLFSDSIAKRELAHQRIPLLIFPINYRAS